MFQELTGIRFIRHLFTITIGLRNLSAWIVAELYLQTTCTRVEVLV